MLKELDFVILTADLPEHGLCAGDVGTIVLVHGKKGYEVEFVSLAGESVAITSVTPDQVRPARKGEVATVRVAALAG